MSTNALTARAPRPLTGRTVLVCFLTFFGIIFAANFFLVRAALTSFSGVETESAYKAGLSFKNAVAAAKAQDARHWKVDATVVRVPESRVVMTARDAEGKLLSGLTPSVKLAHPTDKRRDVPVTVIETAPGQFRTLSPLPEGLWVLEIGLKQGEETVFFSKNRIQL